MRKPVRPCIDRLPDGKGCPAYALPGRSRCEKHEATAVKTGARSGGTTGAWRAARKVALARTNHTCEKCGRTEAEVRAAGSWLEVHHLQGPGVRAAQHDQRDLQVLCRVPCHVATYAAKTRMTLAEHQAQLRARFQS